MSGVAEIDSWLIGTLVGPHLEPDDGLASSQFFLGEDSLILFGFFRTDAGFSIFHSLQKRCLLNVSLFQAGKYISFSALI